MSEVAFFYKFKFFKAAKFGSNLEDYLKKVANYADGLFQELNVRIILSHIEIWKNQNKIEITKDAFEVGFY